METGEGKKRSVLHILAGTLTFFLFFMCLLSLGLYVYGNAKDFTPGTQFLLLRLIAVLGFLTGLMAVFAILINLGLLIYRKNPLRLLGIGGYGLTGFLSVMAALGAVFILTAARGRGA